ESGLRQAEEVAGGRNIGVQGATVAQQLLRIDRLDEICLYVVPVLLGAGKRLFERTRPAPRRRGAHQLRAGGRRTARPLPGRGSGVRRGGRRPFDLEEELVRVAPPPVLARLVGADQRVIVVSVVVPGGVAVRRVVAAADVAAAHAHPQVNPAPAHAHAVSQPSLDGSTSATVSRWAQDAALIVPSTRGHVLDGLEYVTRI